jgi:hypothetical protein
MFTALYNATRSSTGSGNLSLTVKGVLLALVPIIIALAGMFGLDLAEATLVDLIEAISAAIAAVIIVVGLVRKILNRRGA